VSRYGDPDYLAYIDDRIRQVETSQVARYGPEALVTTPDLAAATLYRLQTVAESTQRLSPELKDDHPEIPWRDLGRFRNRVAHGFMDLDMGTVWDVARHDLTPLGEVVRQELARQREPATADDLGLGL
jgi:uncharacterized protein with HEPN domain